MNKAAGATPATLDIQMLRLVRMLSRLHWKRPLKKRRTRCRATLQVQMRLVKTLQPQPLRLRECRVAEARLCEHRSISGQIQRAAHPYPAGPASKKCAPYIVMSLGVQCIWPILHKMLLSDHWRNVVPSTPSVFRSLIQCCVFYILCVSRFRTSACVFAIHREQQCAMPAKFNPFPAPNKGKGRQALKRPGALKTKAWQKTPYARDKLDVSAHGLRMEQKKWRRSLLDILKASG